MIAYVCVTCGVQHAATAEPPARCAVCEDERQYVGRDGQRWTTLEEIQAGRTADVRELEPGLLGIGADPPLAIGQRALLVRTDEGNVLWDCVPLLDDAAAAVEEAGGLVAVAISHPHFYSTMVEWGRRFGVPVLLHEADREWIMRPDPAVEPWSGESRVVLPDVRLVRCGGHFAGSAVLHWAAGAEGRGVLLTADTIYVAQDRRFVSFMRSFPNLIPLGPDAVRGVVRSVDELQFDRLYGGWWDAVLPAGGRQAVRDSADRYLRAIAGTA